MWLWVYSEFPDVDYEGFLLKVLLYTYFNSILRNLIRVNREKDE